MVLVAAFLWVTRSHLPADFDAINFVLGVTEFDLSQHQPHPPGAPVFIALGKVLVWMGMDALDALLCLAVTGGTLIVGIWHRIFLLLIQPVAATAAACVLALMPAIWLSSTQPMSDTLAVAAIAFTQWQLMLFWRYRKGHFVMVAAVSAALAVGIRPQFGMFVLLALFVATFLLRLSFSTALRAVLVFTLVNIAWLLPAVLAQASQANGDWFAYFQLVISFGDEFSVASSSPILRNTFDVMQVWKRALIHVGSMGYFGAGLSVWYPDSVVHELAVLGTSHTPVHVDIREWSWPGTILFSLYAVGALLALPLAKAVLSTRTRQLIAVFAVAYALAVLLLVPPHTRFYLPLLPLVAVLPVIGFARLRNRTAWLTCLCLVTAGSLSSIVSDSQQTAPPPMALAYELAEISRTAEGGVRAMLDSNSRRHVQWVLPGVEQSPSPPDSRDAFMQWFENGGRVFVSSTSSVDRFADSVSTEPVGHYRRPLRVWMRHTGTQLYEVKPNTKLSSPETLAASPDA